MWAALEEEATREEGGRKERDEDAMESMLLRTCVVGASDRAMYVRPTLRTVSEATLNVPGTVPDFHIWSPLFQLDALTCVLRQ